MPKTKTVENQKIVKIHRDMPEKGEGNFLMVKKANLADAYKSLNATSLVVWLYLVGNKDGYDLALSPQAVNNDFGTPITTVKDQIPRLIEKGYLIQHSTGSNIYDFYERPQTPSVSESENGNRENEDDSNGSRTKLTAELREIDNNSKPQIIDNEWRF